MSSVQRIGGGDVIDNIRVHWQEFGRLLVYIDLSSCKPLISYMSSYQSMSALHQSYYDIYPITQSSLKCGYVALHPDLGESRPVLHLDQILVRGVIDRVQQDLLAKIEREAASQS